MPPLPEFAEVPVDQMAARVDQLTGSLTYGGAAATGVNALLQWLADYQGGIATLIMLGTFAVTVISACYGMYHKHQFRKIAREQGINSVRRGER